MLSWRYQFQIAYQPQFRTYDQKLMSAEALIRWHHPIYGEARPGRFIPLSEESGFITKIGEWMIKQACMELPRWNKAKIAGIAVTLPGLTKRREKERDLCLEGL